MKDLLAAVRTRLAAGLPVRRSLPGRGRLHIDRPLPFLCVYRYRTGSGRPEVGADQLVRTQASHLVASGDDELHAGMAELASAVAGALADACGACLLLELWEGPEAAGSAPRILIRTPGADGLATTITALADALRDMTTPVGSLAVEVAAGEVASPPDLAPLLDEAEARKAGSLMVGLEVPPIFRSPDGLYPHVLRVLTAELARALHRGFFEFTRVQTPARPEHYQMMGRRRLVRAVREADQALTEIGRCFDFLLDVSPINLREAWQEFHKNGHERAPALRYRSLAVDPEMVKRRLYDLPLERLEDPVLALLLREKRRELDRQLTLLEDRDDPRFLPGSLQLYGGVDAELMAEALAILEALPASPTALVTSESCGAEEFAARARAEIEHYRGIHPTLASVVKVRDDVPSVMVSHGDLLVPRGLMIAAGRVAPLLQHEIGTHVVTHANGQSQPLCVLGAGLAGYEAIQEGIALFAEHLAGGLDSRRLRIIAARVVAVRRMIERVELPAVVAELSERHGIARRAAFGVAMRVFRGGGLTKDAIYLRGLLQLLAYLAAGGSFEPLLAGKIAIEHVPLVEELIWREVLRPPPLRPRWLDGEAAASRLARAREGMRPLDLVTARRAPT
jgi:uncharacterized protein (TIGR02421 family)